MRKTQGVATLTAAILGATLSAAPATAQAGTCSTTSCTARIIEFTVMSSRIRIRLDISAAQQAKLTNCTLETDTYFTLWPAHTLYKEALMTLRSAQLVDREVTIRTVDGSADCTVSYVRGW